MMRFDVLTLFPEMFTGPLQESIIKRAQERGLISVHLHNIRDYATGRHRITDDAPYGGGGGMVMKPEPIFAAVEAVLGDEKGVPVILLSPQGRLFTHEVARELSRYPRLVLICGRYEGVDERVREHLATDEISIGDYVLSGGELAAMVIIDAVTRLLPGALGDPGATFEDSHAWGLLEYPHYTRPAVFRGWAVPEVLLSGNHAAIARWRREQALRRTLERRPDLLERAPLTEEDRAFLARLGWAQVPGGRQIYMVVAVVVPLAWISPDRHKRPTVDVGRLLFSSGDGGI
jgi:tRNA (guanine37-N1)-methyltransferase